MTNIYLSGYSFRVSNKKRNIVLDSDEDEDSKTKTPDVFQELSKYLNKISSEYDHNGEIKKLIKIDNLTVDDRNEDRTLCGIIKTGEYGFESELINVPEKSLSHKRIVSEAEILPFYFLMSLPKGRDEGIVILERFGQKGVRSIFLNSFNKYFTRMFPQFRVEMNPLVTKKLIDYYLNRGGLKKIRFIRFGMGKNIEDAYDRSDHEEQEGYMELIAHAERGFGKYLPLKGRLKEYLKGDRELQRLIELKEYNFEYDNIKLELEVNKRTRTIDLSDLYKIRAYYDITDGVRMENGHPVFESIDKNARDLLKDLSDAMGWSPDE